MTSNRGAPTTNADRGRVKAADLASGLGAMALGAGLALLAHAVLAPYALHLLVIGLIVHGGGMTLKNRWENDQRGRQLWERALFWLCWLLLAVLVVWMVSRLFAPASV